MNERLKLLKSFTGNEVKGSPSGFMNWLRPTVIAADVGALTFSYIVREDMTNPYRILHGGVTAGIIDDLIGATVFTLDLADAFTTINNSIDYFAPAKLGDEIVAKTSIIKQGRSIINLKCEVFIEAKNRLIAVGYSNMINVGIGKRF
jgi:acyl-coenzyme A thioesterase 13